ncbi:uncharacterized protein DEA37_0010801 [Paragonimus westermani]|uniref:C2 domain-containing protein n=1 Tax=Paragonimus westermani TaxID=34504 RepID=A0A5J4N8A9_9TREM|nr:uncharacterized protein DEA37_0010801 [Paragonimus westermani]
MKPYNEIYDHFTFQSQWVFGQTVRSNPMSGQLKLDLRASMYDARVHVIQARYLQLPLDVGFSTYVQVRIANKREPDKSIQCLRSKSVPDSASPRFDEKFSFGTIKCKRHLRIYIELYLQKNNKPSSYRRHMVAPDILRPLRTLKEQYNGDYESDKHCLAAELDHECKNKNSSFESLSTISSLLTERDPAVTEPASQQMPEILRAEKSVGETTVNTTPFVTALLLPLTITA